MKNSAAKPEFEVYKGKGRKTYCVFKDLSIPKKLMISTANNQYYHKTLDEFKCVPGYIKDDELYLSSQYVRGTQVVWVVHRV